MGGLLHLLGGLGAVGDAVLHDSGGFWTAWILPLAATLFAVQFTEFYPDYASAKFARSAGECGDPPASLVRLVDWLPPFILVTGIVGWVSDALPDALGVALIAVGAVGAVGLRKRRREPKVSWRERCSLRFRRSV